MVFAPTTEQILNLDGVRIRADYFRFYLLDSRDQVIGEIHPVESSTPTLTNDTSASTPRTLSGLVLPASETSAINPITDRVKPAMVLSNGVEFPLGVLLWSTDSLPQRPWGAEHSSTLVDKMLILDQDLGLTLGFLKGADVAFAAVGIASQFLTLDEIEIDALTADLGVGLTWPLGTTARTVLGDLMRAVGFLPPYFNHSGTLRLADAPDLTSVVPTLVYEDGGRVIADSMADSNDILSAPNVFRAYENSGQIQLIGEYRIPAVSPHSVENRRYAVVHSEPVSGLKNQAGANKAAKTLAVTFKDTYRWRSFDSPADPRHDSWDPVTSGGETWLEPRWTMQLVPGGKMNHLLRKVY